MTGTTKQQRWYRRHEMGLMAALLAKLPCLLRPHILSEPYGTSWPGWTQRICLRCGTVADYAPRGTVISADEGTMSAHPGVVCGDTSCCRWAGALRSVQGEGEIAYALRPIEKGEGA